jgi:hypothetical protein
MRAKNLHITAKIDAVELAVSKLMKIQRRERENQIHTKPTE